MQNALVRAWRDLPTLRDPESFDAWLHRLLVRACIDEARRLRRHRVDVELVDISGALPSIPGYESAIADRDQLERGFIRLSPEMRAVIVLHHYLDLPLAGGRGDPRDPRGHREVAAPPSPRADARGVRRRWRGSSPDLAEGRPS